MPQTSNTIFQNHVSYLQPIAFTTRAIAAQSAFHMEQSQPDGKNSFPCSCDEKQRKQPWELLLEPKRFDGKRCVNSFFCVCVAGGGIQQEAVIKCSFCYFSSRICHSKTHWSGRRDVTNICIRREPLCESCFSISSQKRRKQAWITSPHPFIPLCVRDAYKRRRTAMALASINFSELFIQVLTSTLHMENACWDPLGKLFVVDDDAWTWLGCNFIVGAHSASFFEFIFVSVTMLGNVLVSQKSNFTGTLITDQASDAGNIRSHQALA